jgi:hypothetical protein
VADASVPAAVVAGILEDEDAVDLGLEKYDTKRDISWPIINSINSKKIMSNFTNNQFFFKIIPITLSNIINQ